MPAKRNGIATWVEVVIAAGCILFLIALFLPRLQGAREAGRRNACGWQGKNLTLAVLNRAHRNGGCLPGYLDTLPLAEPVSVDDGRVFTDQRVTWTVPVLPFLEQPNLYQHWFNGDAITKAGTADDPVANGYLSILVCPSSGTDKSTPPPCSYVVNAGRQDTRASPGRRESPRWPADWRANGVFFNRYVDSHMNVPGAPLVEMTQDYITAHDGASLTLLMSERLDGGSYAAPPASAADAEAALGFVWWLPKSGGPPLPSQRINGPRDAVLIYNARPSSNHPTGVMVNFCDGHGRFLSQDIDYSIYCKLLTPSDHACNDPGSVDLVPADDSNGYQYLRTAPLDESQIY